MGRLRSPFLAGLMLITLFGLGIRVAWAVTRGTDRVIYDSTFYFTAAHALAEGRGFVTPYPGASHIVEEATHPPLTPVLLAPAAKFFRGDQLPMRLMFALIGAGSIVLIGLLGARVASRRIGLIAASVAAVYPFLWVNDGLIMSESLATALTVATLLAAYRLLHTRVWRAAIWVGVFGGLAALARPELIALCPLIALGIALTQNVGPMRRRVGLSVAAFGMTLMVVSPWVVYNLTRFDRPVFMTTDGEVTLLASSCSQTTGGPELGLEDGACFYPYFEPGDQSVAADHYRERALRYIRAHPADYSKTVLARLGRDWSLFRPLQATVDEGRPHWTLQLGLAFYYPMLVFACAGILVLKRRRATWWPLAMPALIMSLTALVSWGEPRFRATSEPSIIILAAVAIGAIWDHRRTKSATRKQPAASSNFSPTEQPAPSRPAAQETR